MAILKCQMKACCWKLYSRDALNWVYVQVSVMVGRENLM